MANCTDDQIDATFNDCVNMDENNSDDAEIEKLIENSNLLISQLQNDNNASVDLIKSDVNSQKQLKTYIQLLESKLVKLRGEMKDPTASLISNDDVTKNRKYPRERSVSSDSCDSLKEIKNHHNETNQMFSKIIYSEFLQRKNQLEKDSNKMAPLSSSSNNKPVLFGDDYDKQFIEMQTQRQDILMDKEDFSYFKTKKKSNVKTRDEDTDAYSTDENNAEFDSLKKSFHKGNSTNLFFSKIEKKPLNFGKMDEHAKHLDLSSLNLNEPTVCEFSPIMTQAEMNNLESRDRENGILTNNERGI